MKSEYLIRFDKMGGWLNFIKRNQYLKDIKFVNTLLDKIKSNGIIDPLTEEFIAPEEINIVGNNYRETIHARKLNSRTRAVIFILKTVYNTSIDHLRKLKIFAPEAITPFALYMRGNFPFYIGSEYGVDPDDFFPILVEDIQSLSFKDNLFDCIIVNDVFEHLPFLEKALKELYRCLKVGGYLISTFPFAYNSYKTIVKAILKSSGDIEYLCPAEYHGNPVNPKEGSLVFQVPGWDILDTFRDIGFRCADIMFVASEKYGILSNITGVFVCVARK